MKTRELVAGPPGHPAHPPLTDAAIGLYTGAAADATDGAAGERERSARIGER